ncbi:TadE/TadG family type IV pilus assembly protein [Maritalea porphyrae]|uniref:TadE/TadG family type IV pilus assembly protein n=1 Tax=Maritalea porphyrae TaxID=880732 RepID=UPI0022AF1514|nr:TadE/TadG family type IV pilus assembly protein [Maritalea porphyrae]MCZ4271463.1 pilus assembly protein [Maritalea porphyrae]
MDFILSRIRQFGRDESGAFAVIFGVIAIVLLATGGAAVDFVNIQQSRKTTQISLDATVLALQPEIYKKSKGWITNRANDLIEEGLLGTGVAMSISSVEIDKEAGRLYIAADISQPTLFVRLIGINDMSARLISEATRAKNRLEVAMVLDNSGSMSGSRISNLKTAAKLAVDILMGAEDEPEKVFIGLVPFTMNVNVGADKKTATWMDTLGQSSANWDNFDNDDNEDTGHDVTDVNDRFSRFALYDQLKNVSWKGCVEARPYPLDTNDATPNASNGDTYFVPMFNPDGPDSGASTTADYLDDDGGTCVAPTEPGECTFRSWPGTKKKKGSRAPGQYSWWNPDKGSSTSGTDACSCDGQTITSTTTWNDKKKGMITQVTCDTSGSSSLSPREYQERLCKYNGASASPSSGDHSPNGTCISREILPLTNKKSTLKTNITAMVAGGGTNIHMGTIWGWRVLSPTAPYDEGVAYNDGASKVMIIMTDGQNYSSQWGSFNGAYYYPAYSWPYNKRLGDVGWSNSSIIAEMDKRTKEACENAKAKPSEIEIYTIGLGISKSSSNGKMLSACASDAGHAYFPSTPSDLVSTFETIANQLSDLRLSK